MRSVISFSSMWFRNLTWNLEKSQFILRGTWISEILFIYLTGWHLLFYANVNLWLPKWKVGGSPKSTKCIIQEPQLSVWNFMVINPIVVEFIYGPPFEVRLLARQAEHNFLQNFWFNRDKITSELVTTWGPSISYRGK